MKKLTAATKKRILAHLDRPSGLSTKDFEDLGYPFEAFLSYSQMTDEVREQAHAALRQQLAGRRNPWEQTGGGCMVGPMAQGKDYPCDDDFQETETGEVVNVKTTHDAHFSLPTRRGGTARSLAEVERHPGVKKGSRRQVRAPKRKKNPDAKAILRRAMKGT